jgi:hypothetical protein
MPSILQGNEIMATEKDWDYLFNKKMVLTAAE